MNFKCFLLHDLLQEGKEKEVIQNVRAHLGETFGCGNFMFL